jgi:hypothetical protein
MPRQATEKSSTPITPFWLDNFASPDGAIGSLMKNAQAAFETSVKEYSEETLSFLNKRLEHNSEAIAEYRACKDVGALMSTQQKWLTGLAHDYLDEAVRMGEVTRKVLASGLAANGNGGKPAAG